MQIRIRPNLGVDLYDNAHLDRSARGASWARKILAETAVRLGGSGSLVINGETIGSTALRRAAMALPNWAEVESRLPHLRLPVLDLVRLCDDVAHALPARSPHSLSVEVHAELDDGYPCREPMEVILTPVDEATLTPRPRTDSSGKSPKTAVAPQAPAPQKASAPEPNSEEAFAKGLGIKLAMIYFASWDRDNDGVLSADDLAATMRNFQYHGAEAAVLAFLRALVVFDKQPVDRARIRDIMPANSAELARLCRHLKTRSHELFKGGSPDPSSVRQGFLGDCYFVATAGAMAQQRPQDLVRMIEPLPGGNYRVTFPGAKRPVVVSAFSDAELLYYNTRANGLWLGILEKAWGSICNDERWVATANPLDATNGGSLDGAIELLTGHGSDTDEMKRTRLSTLKRKLHHAMGHNLLVTAAFPKDPTIPYQHGYTVVAYLENANRVVLRNPHGEHEPLDQRHRVKDGDDDGVFSMSLEEFDKTFEQITYEEDH